MKAMIWFLCFFVFVMVQVFIKNSGVTLGGIPTVVLFSFTWWLAKELSASWEAKHCKKEENSHPCEEEGEVPKVQKNKHDSADVQESSADNSDDDCMTPFAKATMIGVIIILAVSLLIILFFVAPSWAEWRYGSHVGK